MSDCKVCYPGKVCNYCVLKAENKKMRDENIKLLEIIGVAQTIIDQPHGLEKLEAQNKMTKLMIGLAKGDK